MPPVGSLPQLRDAIATASVDPLDVVFDPDAEASARRALHDSGLLLLGEYHGVAENAAVILALVQRLAVDTLALEWPAELADVVARLAAGGELRDHPLLWLGDGRLTVEHLAAVPRLARAGVRIVAIDERAPAPGASWSELDCQLAAAVLRGTEASGRALVVCGNAHTPTHPTALGVPMGAWIRRARPSVREVVIEPGAGALFNLGPRTFPESGDGADHPPRLCQVGGELRLSLARAHEATVPIADGTARVPPPVGPA